MAIGIIAIVIFILATIAAYTALKRTAPSVTWSGTVQSKRVETADDDPATKYYVLVVKQDDGQLLPRRIDKKLYDQAEPGMRIARQAADQPPRIIL